MRYIRNYNKAPRTVTWKYSDTSKRLGTHSAVTGQWRPSPSTHLTVRQQPEQPHAVHRLKSTPNRSHELPVSHIRQSSAYWPYSLSVLIATSVPFTNRILIMSLFGPLLYVHVSTGTSVPTECDWPPTRMEFVLP